MYYLQSRWKLEKNALYYYGLRNKPDMFRNRVKLSSGQRAIIAALPKDLNESEEKAVELYL